MIVRRDCSNRPTSNNVQAIGPSCRIKYLKQRPSSSGIIHNIAVQYKSLFYLAFPCFAVCHSLQIKFTGIFIKLL